MAKINDIHSIIHPAQNAVVSAYTYTEVYGGSAGCTVVLNGTLTSIGAASSIGLWVRTISGGTGCYVMGENMNVAQGSTIIGSNFG